MNHLKKLQGVSKVMPSLNNDPLCCDACNLLSTYKQIKRCRSNQYTVPFLRVSMKATSPKTFTQGIVQQLHAMVQELSKIIRHEQRRHLVLIVRMLVV